MIEELFESGNGFKAMFLLGMIEDLAEIHRFQFVEKYSSGTVRAFMTDTTEKKDCRALAEKALEKEIKSIEAIEIVELIYGFTGVFVIFKADISDKKAYATMKKLQKYEAKASKTEKKGK